VLFYSSKNSIGNAGVVPCIYCHNSENKQQPSECQGLFSHTSQECESSQAEYQVNVSDLSWMWEHCLPEIFSSRTKG